MIVANPCVGVCKQHEIHNICRGCLRSPLDIAKWTKGSFFEKESILELLSVKREIFGDTLMEGYVLSK